MIHAVIVMNTHGKPRITKFYKNVAADEQQEIVSAIYSALSSKGENFCSFIEADDIFGPETQLVYKHFATLYFVFAIDKAENELAILDLIQLFVEVLDKAFKNVCELDIVYNFNKVRCLRSVSTFLRSC
jgi:AP-3 complex subunit sigma